MLTVLAYGMIIAFVILVVTKKLSAFNSLLLTSLIGGALACIITKKPVTDIFSWIKSGLFYSTDQAGKVSLGTINSAVMILFAILYFSMMMNVGLFDPLITFLIRKAKGDPLRVAVVTAFVASVVTLDGDGTTTVLITTAAFVPLFRQMKMKMSYLAVLIMLPATLGNLLPWGGPLARVGAVMNLDVGMLFSTLLPVLLVSEIYILALSYFMGKKERKRLGYKGEKEAVITQEQIEEMCQAIVDQDKEFKRPKMFLFNLILTIVMIAVLIMGWVSGAYVFLIGTAIFLAANYNFREQRERLSAVSGDALAVATVIISAGALLGILNGSGMSTSIATSLINIIPKSLNSHFAFIFSFIGIPGRYFLTVDSYYFGILPVIAPVGLSLGFTATEIAMSSVMGQATGYASPVNPWLYLLLDRTDVSLGTYQKEFFKYSIPMFFVFVLTALLFGLFPL